MKTNVYVQSKKNPDGTRDYYALLIQGEDTVVLPCRNQERAEALAVEIKDHAEGIEFNGKLGA